MEKQKIYTAIGWLLIVGSLLAALLSYWTINSQEFVVALLARVVEEPFAYRQMLALLSAVVVIVAGCLFGMIYLGLADLMRRKN